MNKKKDMLHKKKDILLKKLALAMKLRDFSEKTAKMYIFYNEKFLKYINKDPRKVTESDIKKFIVHRMVDDYMSSSSIALIKASLKFCYNEIMNRNFRMMKTPKSLTKPPVILTKREIKRILDNTMHPKHRLLIELLYSTGLKLSECINLKYSDLNLKKDIGIVRNRNSSKNRVFIISKIFKKDILEYKEMHIGDEYVFSVNGRKMSPRGIQYAIELAVKRSGIKKNISASTFRHYFAKHLFNNGTNLRKIQRLMGCTYIQAIKVHTHITRSDVKKLKNPLDILY